MAMLKPTNKQELAAGVTVAAVFGFNDQLDSGVAKKVSPGIANGTLWSIDYGPKVESREERRFGLGG